MQAKYLPSTSYQQFASLPDPAAYVEYLLFHQLFCRLTRLPAKLLCTHLISLRPLSELRPDCGSQFDQDGHSHPPIILRRPPAHRSGRRRVSKPGSCSGECSVGENQSVLGIVAATGDDAEQTTLTEWVAERQDPNVPWPHVIIAQSHHWA